MSVNKLKNIWISNDTTNLQGTYSKVSMLNAGKTELQDDTLINTKLAINKNIDTVNDYKLDVNGNINFIGNLYKNNTLFSSGISLADIQANQNNFTNNFTIDNRTVSGSVVSVKSKTLILNTPDTTDVNNYFRVTDDTGRIYFSTYRGDLNDAYVNPNSGTGYTYFNQPCAFQKGVLIQTVGGQGGFINVGGGYGSGLISVNNGIIQVDSTSTNNKLKVNVIDPHNNSVISSIYPSLANTLNIGNPVNTYNVNMYGIWNVLGSINSAGNPYITTNITQNLTANSKTITPAQLGFLNLVSNQQIPTSAILNYGSGFLTSTISSNLSANGLTITPAQLSFLNKVLVAPSLNAGLIPQSAIGNVADFVKNNANTIITATYTFNANPIFQLSAIPLGAIADISINYMDLFNSQSIDGIKTFTSPPVFSGNQITTGTIPVSAIDPYDLTQYINALIPSINTANFVDISNVQTIGGIKTFSSAPVMSGALITAGSIPLTSIANLQANYFKKGLDQTVNNIFTFSTNPIFNVGAIPTTAIS